MKKLRNVVMARSQKLRMVVRLNLVESGDPQNIPEYRSVLAKINAAAMRNVCWKGERGSNERLRQQAVVNEGQTMLTCLCR